MKRIKAGDTERIAMDELDAVFLRNESSTDLRSRRGPVHWVSSSARC